MDHRHVLAIAVLAVLAGLAGCSADGSLSMDPVPNDSAVAEHASVTLDGLEDENRAIVEGAIAGENATAIARRAPFESDRPVATDDGYYAVTSTIVANATRTAYAVRFEADPNDTSGPSIDYEDLPAVDRRHVPIEELRALVASDDSRPPAIGFDEIYTAPERERSVLVPESGYDILLVDGEPVRIANDGEREVTVHTYRYAADRVAASASALASDLRAEYAFALSGLTDAERQIVADAIGDTHYESTRSDAWARLVDRFRDERAIYGEYGEFEYLVRYDGDLYWATLFDIEMERSPGPTEGDRPPEPP